MPHQFIISLMVGSLSAAVDSVDEASELPITVEMMSLLEALVPLVEFESVFLSPQATANDRMRQSANKQVIIFFINITFIFC